MTVTDIEDWLENAVMDSIDIDWTPRDAAKLIVSRMQSEGLVLITRADPAHDTIADSDGDDGA